MAFFYPTMDEIKNDKMEKHTAGEMELLGILSQLGDEYHIYYQPHVNYAHPDIIVVKPKGGVLIIEVKDWNLNSYRFAQYDGEDVFGYLQVENEDAELRTPFQQVADYKDELFELLCSSMFISKINNASCYGIVRTAVFFSMSSKNDVQKLFGSSNKLTVKGDIKKYNNYISYWCQEDRNVICDQVELILEDHSLFTDEHYIEITTLLKPSEEWLEQTQPFELDKKQKEYAACEPGQWIRVRGVAGSGKTLVIAQKAINCYRVKRTPVLIMTYNITLKNYIRDKIAQNSREMSQHERACAFDLVHIDGFLGQAIERYGLKGHMVEDYRDENGRVNWDGYRAAQMEVLRKAKDKIQLYETVLIDEAQDYKSEWFRFVEDVFLAPNAEILVVADEKQNIYGRDLTTDRLPVIPGFSGKWRRLEKSYRMVESNAQLALDFQREFLSSKYEIDHDQQMSIFDILGYQRYLHLDKNDYNNQLFRTVVSLQRDIHISPNDICILMRDINSIRKFDYHMRQSLGMNSTKIMCETKEEYDKICRKHGYSSNYDDKEERDKDWKFQDDISKARSIKKFSFTMNSGTVKICTIHSFKGWEINTAILVIDENDDTADNGDELIYTAITRAKENLIVIDFGSKKFGDFFRKRIENNGI